MVTTAIGDAVADQQQPDRDPPPAHPRRRPCRPSASARRGRARRGAAAGDRGRDQAGQHHAERGRPERDGPAGRTSTRRRPCRRRGAAASSARPPSHATRRRPAPPRGRHDGVSARISRRACAGGGADDAEQPDLRVALADGDADGRGHREQHDQGAPAADDGAHDDERLAVGVGHVPGRTRPGWRTTPISAVPSRIGHERRGERGRAGAAARRRASPVMAPPAASWSRCASWPATASAVGAVHPAGDPAVDEEHDAVGVRRRDRVVRDHHDASGRGRRRSRAAGRARRARSVESRAPVGSSASTTAGSATRARAIATRCCWPPDSSPGRWPARSPSPTRSSRRAPGRGPRRRPASRSGRRDVLLGGQVGQQVEALEHEADPVAAQPGAVVLVPAR